MDRTILYPGSLPQSSQMLQMQRDIINAVSNLIGATIGYGAIAEGFSTVPTSPPSLNVIVGAGTLSQATVLDSSNFGALAADDTSIMKMGAFQATVFPITAPTTPGFSQYYIVETAFFENDSNPVVLPYYNSANPAVPFSGYGNNGLAQNTRRTQQASVQLIAGSPAAAGTETIPAASAGWVPLYIIHVNYGQLVINSNDIKQHAGNTSINYKLPNLTPGFSNIAIQSTGNFIVPNGVHKVKVTLVGGGGGAASSSSDGAHAGAGGGAGGGAIGVFNVTPGDVIPVVVGGAGQGGLTGAAGAAGGSSSFGTSIIAATGGQPGIANVGGIGGNGFGGQFVVHGGSGYDATSDNTKGGDGGGAMYGGGGRASTVGGTLVQAGLSYGSGGGGGYYIANIQGGSGAAGLVIVEY